MKYKKLLIIAAILFLLFFLFIMYILFFGYTIHRPRREEALAVAIEEAQRSFGNQKTNLLAKHE